MAREKAIHYVDIALRIQYDPKLEPDIVAVGRKFFQEKVGIPANEDPDDETTRPMTDAEVAEQMQDVQDCLFEILDANPLLEQLNLEIIGIVTGHAKKVRRFDDLPELHAAFA